MAIKVNGTTVIDDSRNISNIAGGFKTINSTSILGSGNISAGASTTYGAVGTYAFAFYDGNVTEGTTKAGSTLKPGSVNGWQNEPADSVIGATLTYGGSALSGTWRIMGRNNYSSNPRTYSVWVRIS